MSWPRRAGPAPRRSSCARAAAAALALRNVIALAPDANAIRCEVTSSQQATHGQRDRPRPHGDIDATQRRRRLQRVATPTCAPRSPQRWRWGRDPVRRPLFVDADIRPLDGSPTIDAGVADAHTSAADPDGRAADRPGHRRLRGQREPARPPSAPATPGTPEPHATPDPPVHGIPAPVLGETVVVAPGQGKVLVRRPGPALPQARLRGAAAERHGRRRAPRPHPLTTALDEAGRFQTGRFWGSRFQIRQGHGRRHDLADAARRRLRPLPGPRERPRAARAASRARTRPRAASSAACGRATAAAASAPTATTASPPRAAPPGSRATAATAPSPACARVRSPSRTAARAGP